MDRTTLICARLGILIALLACALAPRSAELPLDPVIRAQMIACGTGTASQAGLNLNATIDSTFRSGKAGAELTTAIGITLLDKLPEAARGQGYKDYVACLAQKIGPANLPKPILLQARLETRTNDDNKDKDTGVYADVFTPDAHGQLLARVQNADNSGNDATEYNNGSDHIIILPLTAANVTKDQIATNNLETDVSSQANGNDRWRFNARTALLFSDGTTLCTSQGSNELNSRSSSRVFASWRQVPQPC